MTIAGAAATVERALRIEPDNPLLWTELGRIRMGESNPAQAEAMGRKALSLATGDPAAQSSAWHLIADSLRGPRQERRGGRCRAPFGRRQPPRRLTRRHNPAAIQPGLGAPAQADPACDRRARTVDSFSLIETG